MTSVLVVDDDPAMGAMLLSSLERRGYQVRVSHSGSEALELLAAESVDAVVTDLRMKGLDGIQLCERLLTNYPKLPVVVMTAFGSMDAAVAAMRAGAADFLAKPFKPDALNLILERIVEHRNLVEEVSRLRERLAEPRSFSQILGRSPAIQSLCQVLSRIALSAANVLITGETGTGKELAARAIHDHGERARGPFVAINCAAMPEALLESELFGHAKGAFTDARSARNGLFQQAGGGTIFLDEIGDMPLSLQSKLLRVLQERRVRPVGSDREVEIDVRVLSATHQDLEEGIAAGSFREDLYYRLNVVNIAIPPLRERGNDVLLLAQHFVERFSHESGKAVSGVSSEVARRLLDYHWPGNVRELGNTIERAVALTDHDRLIVDDLPAKLRNYQPLESAAPGAGGQAGAAPAVPPMPDQLASLQDLEREHIERVLAAVGGNKARAARILGLDRKTLYRRLEQYAGEEQGSAD